MAYAAGVRTSLLAFASHSNAIPVTYFRNTSPKVIIMRFCYAFASERRLNE